MKQRRCSHSCARPYSHQGNQSVLPDIMIEIVQNDLLKIPHMVPMKHIHFISFAAKFLLRIQMSCGMARCDEPVPADLIILGTSASGWGFMFRFRN